MSSKNTNRFWKTISFRLWLWYAAVFAGIAILLLVTINHFLSSSLTEKDRAALNVKLAQLSAVYQNVGISEFAKQAGASKIEDPSDAFYIRIAEANNQTRFTHNQELFPDFDFDQLEKIPQKEGMIQLFEKDAEEFGLLEIKEVMDIASQKMPDGFLLQVGKSSENRVDFIENFRITFAAVLIPLFLLGGTLLSFRRLSPLRAMISTVHSIQTGKMDSRVPVRGTGDELDQLARLFNEMLDRINNLVKGMRNSLDHVAHDLRTPITRFRVTAETALESEPSIEKYQEALAECLEESDRILNLLNTLMDISEAETGSMHLNLETVNVPGLIHDSVEMYRYIAEDKDIKINTRCPQDITMKADKNRIRQVLSNLVDNAIKYTEPGGQIEVEANWANGEAVILVKDTGIGIVSDELPRIWDRLYRSDKTRGQKGMGLGLSLVRAVVKAHGGRVEAASDPGHGSVFRLYFPRA